MPTCGSRPISRTAPGISSPAPPQSASGSPSPITTSPGAAVSPASTRWPVTPHPAPLDAAGNKPCYTFFYPQEDYDFATIESLAELSRTGITDAQIHIHHDRETPAGFIEKMSTFIRRLHEDHGLLHVHNGRPMFGFIHGNRAHDNSPPGGN